MHPYPLIYGFARAVNCSFESHKSLSHPEINLKRNAADKNLTTSSVWFFFFLEYFFLYTFEIWALITTSILWHRSGWKSSLFEGERKILRLWGGLSRSSWMLMSESKVSEPFDWWQGWRNSSVDCGVLSLNILEEPQSYAFKISMLLWISQGKLTVSK